MRETDQDTVESLASLGSRTLALLTEVLTALATLAPASKYISQAPVEIVAEEITRFKLWSGNIGLLHHGHASLDYRLRDAPAVERFVRTLLSDLHETMSNVLQVVSGRRLPFEEMEVADSDDDLSDAESGHSTTSSASVDGQGTELESRVSETRSVIDRLFRLSTKIRNPASRVGHSKAMMLKDIDHDTGVDLMDAHAFHDKLHIREVLTSLRNGIGLDVEQYGTFLIERLSSANKQRRQQFKYWKKHREKLARHEIKEQAINRTQLLYPGPVDAQPIREHSEKGTHTHVSLPTTATALIQEHVDLDDTKSVGTSYSTATSVFSNDTSIAGAERLILPPPPVHLLQGNHFECPYCFTLCPKRYLQTKSWREHLWRDLRPYVCTYETCQEASQLYDSRSDWLKHESWAHRRIWRCSDHATEHTSEEDYKSHMHLLHGFSYGQPLNTMALSATAAATSAHRNCPFCLVPLSKVRGSPEQHVSHHLERVASFALPQSTPSDQELGEQEDDVASGQANTAIGTSSDGASVLTLESAQSSSLGSDRPIAYEDDEVEQVAPPDITETGIFDALYTREPERPLLPSEDTGAQASDQPTDEGTAEGNAANAPSLASTESRLDQVFAATRHGDAAIISSLLQQGLELGENAWPLLRQAASGKHEDATKVLWDHIWGKHPAYVETLLAHFSPSTDTDMVTFILEVLCKGGDANSLRSLLDYTPSNYFVKPNNLMVAIRHDQPELLKVMLHHRRFQGLNGTFNALYEACKWGYYQIVNILLQEHANPDGDTEDFAPLCAAAERGSLQIVELLLSYQADIDCSGWRGYTPLGMAAMKGHHEIVSFLLDLGADLNKAARSKATPILAAASNGHESIVLSLIENGAAIDAADVAERTALFHAILGGHTKVADMLLNHGADATLNPQNEATLLQLAARLGAEETIQSLLAKGAQIEQLGALGLTPLYEAAASGQYEAGRILVTHGANVNAISTGGKYQTPLLAACANHTPELVALFLNSGADFQFQDENVGTVLNLACSKDDAEIVKIILEHTATLPRSHPFLTKAYLQICIHRNLNLIPVMTAWGVKPDGSALAAAIDSGASSLVRALIMAGADSNASYRKITPLGRATMANNLELVKELLSLGAAVDGRTWYPENARLSLDSAFYATPLEISRLRGYTDIDKYLTEHGADETFITAESRGARQDNPIVQYHDDLSSPGTEVAKQRDINEQGFSISLRAANSYPDLRSYTPSPVQSLSNEDTLASAGPDAAAEDSSTNVLALPTRQDLQGRKLYILDMDDSIDETSFTLYFQQFGPLEEATLLPAEPPQPALGLIVYRQVETASSVLQQELRLQGKPIVALPALHDPTKSRDYWQELQDLRSVVGPAMRQPYLMPSHQRLLNHLASAGISGEEVSPSTMSRLTQLRQHLDEARTVSNEAYVRRDVADASVAVEYMEAALLTYQAALQRAKADQSRRRLTDNAAPDPPYSGSGTLRFQPSDESRTSASADRRAERQPPQLPGALYGLAPEYPSKILNSASIGGRFRGRSPSPIQSRDPSQARYEPDPRHLRGTQPFAPSEERASRRQDSTGPKVRSDDPSPASLAPRAPIRDDKALPGSRFRSLR